MNRFFILVFVLSLSLNARAQTKALAVVDLFPTLRSQNHVPEDSSVVMAEEKSRKTTDVAPDVPIKYIETRVASTTHIRKEAHLKRSKSWLTALYLRPVEEKVVNRTIWPLVPALLLEAVPTLSVTTPSGPKTIKELRKGDVLYRYDSATQQLSTWEVGIVKRKSRRAESPYSLATENGGFLFEHMVAMQP